MASFPIIPSNSTTTSSSTIYIPNSSNTWYPTITTSSTYSSNTTSYMIPTYEAFFENFGWLVERLPYTEFSRKINIKVCAACKKKDNLVLELKEVYKTKCVFCHKTSKILFVWKDSPPSVCPYELEHVVSDDKSDLPC